MGTSELSGPGKDTQGHDSQKVIDQTDMTGMNTATGADDQGQISTRMTIEVVSALLPDEPSIAATDRTLLEQETAEFVTRQLALSPSFVRRSCSLLLWGLDWYALVRYRRRFVSLDGATKRRYLDSWNSSRFRAMQELLTLIRSCAYLKYLDHPTVLKILETETDAISTKPPITTLGNGAPANVRASVPVNTAKQDSS